MHLVLVLPGLLAPPGEAAARPPLPSLARLLATAGGSRREPEGVGAVLAPLYRVARQDDWPLAPLRLLALGVDPGDDWCLAADPVALVAGRDDVRLAGVVADLAADESASMLAALNAHFALDGLAFVAPRPAAWFVRSASAPRLRTHDIGAAAGRPLRALLPEGPDAGRWRRWLSEIQMLLHAHPANAARESRGRTAVASVWFSGGGTMPPRAAAAARVATWADEGIATALAFHAGAPAGAPPSSGLAAVLRERSDAATGVVAFAGASDLAVVERAWLAPAWEALGSGVLQSVTIVADGAGHASVWTARRPGRWTRWKTSRARHDLDALLDAARASA